jgi:hypothetical protein
MNIREEIGARDIDLEDEISLGDHMDQQST